jgi:murein DD-endopeptidase MepM/ murein hydrolase activator NlpD
MTTYSSPLDIGARKTSDFAPKRKLFGVIRPHAGTDYASDTPGKSVPIYAIADGTVEAVGWNVLAGHSGRIVVLNHGTHNGKSLKSNYGHMASYSVTKGQKVKAGEKIGMTGKSGNVTGVHLHLGIRVAGSYIDPDAWLKDKGIDVGQTKPVIPPKVLELPSTRQLQNRLKKMGFVITADGINGERTQYVVKQYQKVHGLVQDGVWGQLCEQRYQDVLKIQKYLADNGYPVLVDGYHGPSTQKALQDMANKTGKSVSTILKRVEL